MIKSLHISNYALISRIDIDFTPGLNIITGETGAGKSIMLGALNLILGARADTKVIADGSKKSVVEVEFVTVEQGRFAEFFDKYNLDSCGGSIILRRELAPSGRSRAFVNDTPVSLAQLKELALMLVDIHSQHQNLLLADPHFQMRVLDSMASNAPLLADYQQAYSAYQDALHKFSTTRDLINRSRNESDFIAYQLAELDEIELTEGEETELEEERDRLETEAHINENISAAISLIGDESEGHFALDKAAMHIREIADELPAAQGIAERVDALVAELAQAADDLLALCDASPSDSSRLDEVNHKLGKLYSLQTKHHLSSSAELIKLREDLRSQLSTLQNAAVLLADLEQEARKAKKEAVLIARRLSESRQAAATALARQLQAAAQPLAMPNLVCEISVEQTKLNHFGMDAVNFLFAFNKNQAPLPVAETASGGEISRIMLSLKAIVGEKMNLPTIIFDEVDTGVSGNVAHQMGLLMQELSKRIQVITITHLPQVAAKGFSHFKVYKQDADDATNTFVRKLSSSERVAELAAMLSGSSIDEAAMQNAKILLEGSVQQPRSCDAATTNEL